MKYLNENTKNSRRLIPLAPHNLTDSYQAVNGGEEQRCIFEYYVSNIENMLSRLCCSGA